MYAEHTCRGYGWHAMSGHRGRRGRSWGGGYGYPGRGPRARRGDVRAAILALLAEEPRNGYQIIQELGERTGGVWQPSPGSVYPALSVLEDEGLIRSEEVDGRRAFALTDEGRAHFEEHKDEIGAPWDKVTQAAPDGEYELRDLGRQLFAALVQVVTAGNEEQVKEAKAILTDARKRLYRILAEED